MRTAWLFGEREGVAEIRWERVRGGEPRPPVAGPGAGSPCPAADAAAAFSVSGFLSSCAGPRWAVLREPRREADAIGTAAAPEAVVTVGVRLAWRRGLAGGADGGLGR